jgi:TRAP-type C4-dicarboxylate transport system permease small subunit
MWRGGCAGDERMSETEKNNGTREGGVEPGVLPGVAGSTLRLLDGVLGAVETFLLGAGLLLMVFLLFSQGVLSRPLGFDWPWSEKAALNLMFIVLVVGASVAVRERRHVAIEVLVKQFPVKTRALVTAAGAALSAVACFKLLGSALNYYHTFRSAFSSMTVMEFEIHRHLVSVPLWYTRWLLPVAVVLLCVRFCMVCADELCVAATGKTALKTSGDASVEAAI